VKDFGKYEKQIIRDFPEIDKIKKTVKENGKEVEKEKIKSKGYKGGGFLLQKTLFFLKGGGKLITVMDDGVLNTDEYENIRNFIRKHYFIKAVISLPQITFKHLAKSSPKASIIYLVKKHNPQDVQKEPIFFAHAEKVGIDTRGKRCRNDLDSITEKFQQFEDLIDKNKRKHDGFFNKENFAYNAGALPKNE
jgi:type I restriction enzyme M protein